MSGTTWTSGGGNNNWFDNGFFTHNWSNNIPVLSSTGTQSVVISGLTTTQPLINGSENGHSNTFFVDQQGFTGTNHLTEVQIDGLFITLTAGANLTVQGIAIGNYHGTGGVEPLNGTISNLTAATGTLAAYDTHLMISATGTDTLTDNDDSQNFGLIGATGAGNKLNITIFPGGNAQTTHTLYNYGLIEASNGGIVDVATAAAANGTVAALANPGWIEALGGTFITSAFIQDDANVPNGAGTPDGYIEIGSAGSAMLLGGADAKQEVLFLDGTSDTLELANNNSFQGNIAGFSGNNTIELAGYTGASSLSYAGSLLTVTELTGGNAVTLDIGAGYNPADFLGVQAAGGLDILTGNVVSSTISNALFAPVTAASGTVIIGETVSGTINSVYNSGGTLIGEVGTAVLTETLANGAVTTETFAIDATGTIGGLGDYGAGITTADSAGLYEIYLQSVSSTGTGPLFTDLHLDWNSDSTQSLFIGSQSNHFSALVGPSVTTETLLSVGTHYIDYDQHYTLPSTGAVITQPIAFGTHGSLPGLNELVINNSVAGTNSPYTGPITSFGLNDDIVIGPATLPSLAAGADVALSYTGSLLSVSELSATGSVIATTTLDVGTGYAANSFVALLGTNGINIETPQTVDEQSFILKATGPLAPLANFEDPTQYASGLAPGDLIVAGETVTVVPASLADLTSSLTNNGLILLDGANANFEANDPLSGTGTVSLTGGAELVLQNTAGVTTDTIAFGAGGNVLALDSTGTASFGGVIAGINGNDEIDLGGSFLPSPPNAADVKLSFNTGTGVLAISDTVNGTIYTDSLTFAGAVPGTFSVAVTGNGIIITDIPCFAAGTRILTPDGDAPVQSLAVGDEVLTLRNDGDAVRKIIWVGRRTIDLARHPRPEKVIPVRILAGALGTGLPERDLVLSPDHCLYIDGHLIEAKTLVNGATIIQDDGQRHITYHHIELERHDIVLAEGVPVETYLDSNNRQMFDGAAAVLHPDFAPQSRKKSCAKLVLDGQIVRAARQRLLDRALALGFAITDETDLMVKAGIERLRPEAGSSPEKLSFDLSQRYAEIDLLSSAGVPAHMAADPDDRRRLGVAVTAIRLLSEAGPINIALNDPGHRGFHEAEPTHRWTNGAARIALPPYTGRATLEIHLLGQAARWITGSKSTAISA
jgi:hypothetical protein